MTRGKPEKVDTGKRESSAAKRHPPAEEQRGLFPESQGSPAPLGSTTPDDVAWEPRRSRRR